MPTIPFMIPMQANVAANQSAQLTYSVPNSWKQHLYKLWMQSTGSFNIFQFQDNTGRSYANITSANPIKSTFVQDPTNPYGGWYDLIVSIDLDGGKIFQIGVIDTSNSSNLIQFLLSSTADIP